ncbi:putative reverse transcriptase domain-containing protein [Tanacetum coccineum]
MIVRGCRLELQGHAFITNFIPFGHGSFDVIIGMDWLSKLRAKIVCFEKIVQIPISNGENLEVYRERPERNLKQLKTMKVNEPKLEDIPVVHLIPRAVPVAKSPYCLAPTKMQELSNQLKELQEKGFIQPSSSPWDALENAFQTLKDMLCDAPILALPEGPNDFVVYCDASNQGFGCVLMQRNKRRWIELFSDYDYEICYHPFKVNVVADALSRKERMKLRRARAMSMTIQSSIKAKILEAQSEVSKGANTLVEMLKGLDK